MTRSVTKKFKPQTAECIWCEDKLVAEYQEFVSCTCYKAWDRVLSHLPSDFITTKKNHSNGQLNLKICYSTDEEYA